MNTTSTSRVPDITMPKYGQGTVRSPQRYNDGNPEACVGQLDMISSDGTYEVAFDGDQDPMSPRSMSAVRKWMIVIIVCTSTLCV